MSRPKNISSRLFPSLTSPIVSLIPSCVTICLAVCVARSKSFAAPLVISPKTISSLTRPLNKTEIRFINSDFDIKNLSSSGNCKVYPSAAWPLGMIEIL